MRIACLAVVSFVLALSSRAWAYSSGITSSWGFNSPTGCNGCHSTPNGNPGPTLVSAPTPIVVANGATVKYMLTVTTQSSGAGLNATAYSTSGGTAAGTLTTCSAAGDANCGNLQVMSGQITHTTTHAGATVSFAFNYTAPASGCFEDELQIWVLSTNLSATTTGDHATRYDVLISNSGSVCRAASCSNGTETLAATCTTTGTCPSSTQQSCGGFACNGATCFTSCTDDTHCITGDYCNGGTACTPKATDGNACNADDECQSNHCADHTCCATACTEQCGACNVTGHEGTCTAVTGAPVGGRTPCTTDGSACGGACDGATLAACAYPGAATSCRAGSCTAGVATLAASCTGTGACPAVMTQTCGEYACGATQCDGTCSTAAECAADAFCAAGVCMPKQPDGMTCGADEQCASGTCADNTCCATACAGQCEACNVAGHEGTCTIVTGAPHGGRAACAGTGECGGACAGDRNDACAFPGAEKVCGSAACSDGVASAAAACNGSGTCDAPVITTCDSNACDGDVCAEPGKSGKSGGCSAGGGASALSGLTLALLLSRRRRTAQRA